MTTYSFADVLCTLTGPGGIIPLGAGAGTAEEGITVEMTGDKNTLTVGSDGKPMNSLHAGNPGRMIVRLLKTSPTNAALMALYNFQKASGANWGQNVIVVSDIRGDFISGKVCAFSKVPTLTYATVAGLNEWVFDAGAIDHILGIGTPDVNT